MRLKLQNILHTEYELDIETSNDRFVLINNSNTQQSNIILNCFKNYLYKNDKRVLELDYIGGVNSEYNYLILVQNFLNNHQGEEIFLVFNGYQSFTDIYKKMPQLLVLFVENRRIRMIARTDEVESIPTSLLSFASILHYSQALDFQKTTIDHRFEKEVEFLKKSDFIFSNNGKWEIVLVKNPFEQE